MGGGGFCRSLWLLALFCFVRFSTEDSQEGAVSRTGRLQLDDANADIAAASAQALSSSLGHSYYPTQAPYYPPYNPTQSPYYPPYNPTQSPFYPPYNPTQSPIDADCLYEEQVINQRGYYDCSVCVCVRRSDNQLHKVCGSCYDCNRNNPTENPVTPTPSPPRPHPTTPLPPPPPPQPSCDPLPPNQYYQNPIDPCQICICRQENDVFGLLQPPTIECRPNPQCVVPTTLPPPPIEPPNPLPVCSYYPANVWFPHPSFSCYLCRCEGPTPFSPQPRIDCYPDPACEPTPSPYITPLPPPTPPTTPAPPTPNVDPLPGPSPHPSCRPFTPNQPFQHPWDPCLACVCTEAFNGAVVNVQVNCFTKPECCIIPPGGGNPGSVLQPIDSPQPQTLPPSSYPPVYPPPTYYPGSSAPSDASAIANANANAGYGSANSLAQAGAAAEAAAQAQSAAVQANLFNQYQQPGLVGGGQDAYAQAQAQADTFSQIQDRPEAQNYPNSFGPSGSYANANANAVSNGFSQLGPYTQPGAWNQQPTSYLPNPQQASYPYGLSSYGLNPYQAGSTGFSSAQADASAQGLSQNQADANALAVAQSDILDQAARAQGNAGGYQFLYPQQGGTAQAQANAIAQGQSSAQSSAQASAGSYRTQPNSYYYNVPNGPTGPFVLQPQSDLLVMRNKGQTDAERAAAQAQAKAWAIRSGAPNQADDEDQRAAAAAAQAQAEAWAQRTGAQTQADAEALRVAAAAQAQAEAWAQRSATQDQADATVQRAVAQAQADAWAQRSGAQTQADAEAQRAAVQPAADVENRIASAPQATAASDKSADPDQEA